MPGSPTDIHFPLGGNQERLAFQNQEPYTCSESDNMWPRDPIAGRMRGGSRPGLIKAFDESVGGPVHLLSNVRVTQGSEADARVFEDETFNASQLAGKWTHIFTPLKLTDAGPDRWSEAILEGGLYKLPTGEFIGTPEDRAHNFKILGYASSALVSLSMDVANPYSMTMDIYGDQAMALNGSVAPLPKPPSGVYGFFLRMSDATDPRENGVIAYLDLRDNFRFNGEGHHLVNRILSITEYSNGAVANTATDDSSDVNPDLGIPLRLKVTVDGNDITITYQHTRGDKELTLTVGAPAGQRLGFGVQANTSDLWPANIGGWPYSYHTLERVFTEYSGTTQRATRNMVVAVGGENAASGAVDIKFEKTPNALTVPNDVNAITNAKGYELVANELLGKLYIVGETDTSGTPVKTWIFDPSADVNTASLSEMTSSPGTAPLDNILVSVWRNRLCTVRQAEQWNVNMSRSGTPLDWDYAPIPQGSAVKLNTTGIDTGALGQPINALIAHSDDYLIIGCADSLYVLRGDPTINGQIDRLSSSIGIVAPHAWARGPNGETVFLSHDGVYGLGTGGSFYPQSISREKLPEGLRDIDAINRRVYMAYDVRNRGFFIGVVSVKTEEPGVYFWFDWEFKGFWPMTFASHHEPTSLVYRNADAAYDQNLLLGCRDGYVRSFSSSANTDDGEVLSSSILIGPILLGGSGYTDGMLREVIGQLGLGSEEVKCEVLIGNSAEEAFNATPRDPFTLKAGKNLTTRPCRRGGAAFLKLSSTGRWAYENMTVVREQLGKQRL